MPLAMISYYPKSRNANHETHEKARKERDLRMIGLSLTGWTALSLQLFEFRELWCFSWLLFSFVGQNVPATMMQKAAFHGMESGFWEMGGGGRMGAGLRESALGRWS